MRENNLNELQGVSILTKDFFNKLIRRIESTKPLAGDGVTIKETENGFKISSNNAVSQQNLQTIDIGVCSGGVPATITIYYKP
jgi:hypothetical protein